MTETRSPSASRSWRLTLVLDGFNPRARESSEPHALSEALVERGHQIERHEVHGGLWSSAHLESPARVDPERISAALEPAAERITSGLVDCMPEALVAYDGSSPAAWIAARAAGRLGVPLVVIEPGWNDLKRLRDRVLESFGRRLWGRQVRQRTKAVLAFDPLALSQALERGFPAAWVELCEAGTDRRIFRPGQPTRLLSKHRLGGRLLLSVGPFEPGRGLELLVRAFAGSVGQREDWSLVLVGEGTLGNRLVTLATRLGVAAQVRLLPFPSSQELAGLMGAATLYAMPAEDERPRGIQVGRALSCGVPVVCSDLPRYRFRIQDGCDGVLVPPADVAAWTRALGDLARAPELRAQMAREARSRAEQSGWERVAQRLELALDAGLARMSLSEPSNQAG